MIGRWSHTDEQVKRSKDTTNISYLAKMVYWGWIVCLSFLVLFTLCAGIAFSFNELVIPLSKDFQVSFTVLNWLGTLPTSLPLLLAPCATMLHYKLGTRKTVLLGVFVASTSLALSALMPNILALFVFYGVIFGSAMTLIINPPFFLLDDYFPYHHPRHVLATSIIACAFPVATLSFNPISFYLLKSVGWRLSYSILAVSLFVIGVLTSITFRSRTQEEDKLPLEESETYGTLECDEASMVETKMVTKKATVIMGSVWFMASMLKAMGYYTPYLTLVQQTEVLGITQERATVLMTVAGSCEVISRLLTSYIGDYIKGKLLYTYVAFCLALVLLNGATSVAHSYSHMIVYAAGLGLFGGPILAAIYSSCSEVLLRQKVPLLFTVFRVGLGVGSIAGPTLAGMIYDFTGTFKMVYVVNSLTYLSAGVLYAVIIVLNKWQPSWVFSE